MVSSWAAEVGDLFLIYTIILIDFAYNLINRLTSIIWAQVCSTKVCMLSSTPLFSCCTFDIDDSQAIYITKIFNFCIKVKLTKVNIYSQNFYIILFFQQDDKVAKDGKNSSFFLYGSEKFGFCKIINKKHKILVVFPNHICLCNSLTSAFIHDLRISEN